jgi:hypothetical protein
MPVHQVADLRLFNSQERRGFTARQTLVGQQLENLESDFGFLVQCIRIRETQVGKDIPSALFKLDSCYLHHCRLPEMPAREAGRHR